MENSDAPISATSTVLHKDNHQTTTTEPALLGKTTTPPLTTDETSAPMEDSTMDGTDNVHLTHGLEALLGGLDPMPSSTRPTLNNATPAEPVEKPAEKNITPHPPIPGLFSLVKPSENASSTQKPIPTSRPNSSGETVMTDALPQPTIPGMSSLISLPSPPSTSRPSSHGEVLMTDAPQLPSIPGLFSLPNASRSAIPNIPIPEDAETLIRTFVSTSAAPTSTAPIAESLSIPVPVVGEGNATAEHVTSIAQDTTAIEDTGAEEEHAEWEADSSPIESSSDSSSSDDSSDDDSDSDEGENSYKFLSPEEQAKVLMEAEGSDDEGGNAKHKGAPPRTGHEIEEVVIPKPDVTITQSMRIVELGAVEVILDNIVLIKARTSGEYRVLETGSVLCLEDRSVVGVVAETLGRVQQPLYSMLFTNAAEITAAGLSIGTTVLYSEQHATYVFTESLKAFKGSDASNLYDEEINDDEREFSDDEQEMEHKRRKKQKWREDHPQKAQQNGRGGGNHPPRGEIGHYDANQAINYDDIDEDGPYKPLARPPGFADTVGRNEAPQEGDYQNRFQHGNDRPQNGGRGRGRGDRDRGRGGRGRGDRGQGGRGRGDRDGVSKFPSAPYKAAPYQPQGRGFTQPSQQPSQQPSLMSPTNYYNVSPLPQNPPSFPQFPGMQTWPFPPPPPQVLQQFLQAQQNGWPNMNQAAPPASGVFLNPAFFTNTNNNNTQNGASGSGQWNQQGQNGRGRGK